MKKKIRQSAYLMTVMAFVFMLTNSCKKDEENKNTVTDIDGKVYQTVTIGTQIWMKENLKVTHYRNGDPIPNVTDSTAWNLLTAGAYCDYNNLQANSSTYGKLYNWYSVNDSKNIAPIGWHIPTDIEWNTLITFLGGDSVAGGKLKEISLAHWLSPNTGATNESGFTALPAGCCDYYGKFTSLGTLCFWWCSNEFEELPDHSWCVLVSYDKKRGNIGITNKNYGFSVRCLKDK